MIERHAIGDATAAIVARDREVVKPQPLHDDHHVVRHGPFRVGRMVRGRDRATAAPVAAPVGADDREVVGEQRGHLAPHEVCLREPVQEEERWAGPGPAQKNAGAARVDFGGFEGVHLQAGTETDGFQAFANEARDP